MHEIVKNGALVPSLSLHFLQFFAHGFDMLQHSSKMTYKRCIMLNTKKFNKYEY